MANLQNSPSGVLVTFGPIVRVLLHYIKVLAWYNERKL
jgi:hypothetical protein